MKQFTNVLNQILQVYCKQSPLQQIKNKNTSSSIKPSIRKKHIIILKGLCARIAADLETIQMIYSQGRKDLGQLLQNML